MKIFTNMLDKNKLELFGFLILLNLSQFIHAQEESNELLTDRPDQTESSAVVPLHTLQIETGFVMEKNESNQLKQTGFAYNTTLLRYGLLHNVELRLGLEYLSEKLKIKSLDSLQSISGLSPLYTGFKVKITEGDGIKPELAILGGIVFPFTAKEEFKPEFVFANMRLAASHNLSKRFSLGYNLGVEWDGNTAVPGYFYSLAFGIGLTDKVGIFLEGFGLVPENGDSEHLLDAGITYLILPNLQFDCSGGLGINDAAIDRFIGFGLSYRLPK